MKLRFMQLGSNTETLEDNELDRWELVSEKIEEESRELIEAIKEGELLHVAEETFDIIQVAIRSLVLLKKSGINLEVESKQHNKKLAKRKWQFIRLIKVIWYK